jgi:hypothetical protein
MSESREQLELELLRAQIRNLNRQSPLLSAVGGSVAGVVISVVASLIIVAAVYLLGEGWVATVFERKNQIATDVARLEQERVSLTRERDSLARAISALAGTATLYDQGIDLTVDAVESDLKYTSLVHAASSSAGVEIRAYDSCPGRYAFPGGAPAFGSSGCREIPEHRRSCTSTESRTSCSFGPFFVTSDHEVGIWLVAATGDKRAVRYVSISPEPEAE